MKYNVVNIERKDLKCYIVYARKQHALPSEAPEIFHVQNGGEFHKAAQQALETSQYWDVPMDQFKTNNVNPRYHEELDTIDIETLFKKSLKISTKARFSDINSAFADYCSVEQLLENVKGHIEGDNKVYEANITSLLNGRVYKTHHIKPLYAEDDDEALKVALSVLQQREGRDVREEDLLSCEITCLAKDVTIISKVSDSLKEKIYANKKLVLQKSVISSLYKFTHRQEYKMYKEALTFQNGTITVFDDRLTICKTDGTEFYTMLSHMESDFATETYEGEMNGNRFRFLTSGRIVKTLGHNMVTFASISTSGWAVHYNIR